MKTIKITLSLALGMTAACYVGPGDDLEPGIDQNRTDKLTLTSGRDADVRRDGTNCDKPKDAALQVSFAGQADPQSQQNPPPPPPPGQQPPNAASEQELTLACEELEGIDMTCDQLCEGAGLVFTGEVRIDPGSVTTVVSPPQDTGMICPDGMPEMTQTTTTTAACACCCAAPPSAS